MKAWGPLRWLMDFSVGTKILVAVLTTPSLSRAATSGYKFVLPVYQVAVAVALTNQSGTGGATAAPWLGCAAPC